MTSIAAISQDRRFLYLSGTVTRAHTRAVLRFLLDIGKRKGVIVINSHGGCETEGMAMYDLIRPYAKQLTAVAVGEVQSAAVLPFLACGRRLTGRETAFMFHHGTAAQRAGVHQREILNVAEETKRCDDRYMTAIAERTGTDVAVVRRQMRFGHYFSAQEALKNGFAHAYLGRLR